MKALILALLIASPIAHADEISPETRQCIINLVEAGQTPIERILDFCQSLNSPGEQ